MWRTGTHATPKRPMHDKTRQQFLSTCRWTASSRAAGSTHLRCSHRCIRATHRHDQTLDQLHMHGCTWEGGTIRASSVVAPKRLLTSVLGSPNIQVSAFQTQFLVRCGQKTIRRPDPCPQDATLLYELVF
jgi:hypothetical protein